MKEIKDLNFTRGYFGKLPSHGDFVKLNAGNNEILIIDKWLQEGITIAKQKLKNDWKIVYKNLLPIKFFYPFTGTDKFIAGIIFPSSDKSGRDFPFLIFLSSNNNIFNAAPNYIVPLIFQNEFREFENIFKNLGSSILPNILNENMNETTFLYNIEKANEKYQNYIDNQLQEYFWPRILGENEFNKYHLVSNIFNSGIKNSDVALEFNLILNNENNFLDICFLLNLITASKSNKFFPAMFWTNNLNNDVLLFIFPLKTTPINYFNIIYPLENSDSILTMDRKIESVPIPEKIKNILDKEDLSLRELLQDLNT